MQYLDLTLDKPVENVALDEALLDTAELAGQPTEILRIWEPRQLTVVAGSSSRLEQEVHLKACREHGIEVTRRSSGGAAIVTGPGCLMYAVVLSYELRPGLRNLDEAHRFVLHSLAESLRRHFPDIRRRGTSDLALAERKFSGNSLRCKRNHLLYHGTLLYDFPLSWIETCLATPPRQPKYRGGRPHHDFVANLPLEVNSLRQALLAAFDAKELATDWPQALTLQLVAEKFGARDWIHRL